MSDIRTVMVSATQDAAASPDIQTSAVSLNSTEVSTPAGDGEASDLCDALDSLPTDVACELTSTCSSGNGCAQPVPHKVAMCAEKGKARELHAFLVNMPSTPGLMDGLRFASGVPFLSTSCTLVLSAWSCL
jgi:hypothetical protein